MTIETVVGELLRDGLDDWLPLDALLSTARKVAEENGGDFRVLVIGALEHVLSEGLMEIGDLGSGGFEAWTLSPSDAVKRVAEECAAVNWLPKGSLCWLSNTERGNRQAALSS